MKVLLKHTKNPDIKDYYWSKMRRPRAKEVKVESFEDASAICKDYIERYHLGGGNWAGGKITDDDGKEIARVSFNRKVWSLEDKLIFKGI
jgi:hypothetical protein